MIQRKVPPKRIIQVIPATGWEVVYKDDDTGEEFTDEVLFFGLVEEIGDEGTAIAGEVINSMVPMILESGRYIAEAEAYVELRKVVNSVSMPSI